MNDTIAALADRDRCTALSCLDDYRAAVDVEALATDVVAARTDVPHEDVTEDARRKAAVRLYHVDLPKLDDAGFVDFDHHAGTVRRSRGAAAAPSPTFSD